MQNGLIVETPSFYFHHSLPPGAQLFSVIFFPLEVGIKCRSLLNYLLNAGTWLKYNGVL